MREALILVVLLSGHPSAHAYVGLGPGVGTIGVIIEILVFGHALLLDRL